MTEEEMTTTLTLKQFLEQLRPLGDSIEEMARIEGKRPWASSHPAGERKATQAI
jgi:hypothetical protein